jgi:CRP-like cAMP-binding protein
MRGRVRISAGTAVGKEVFLNIMEAGDSLWEIALLDDGPRTATATTMMRTELLIIEREYFSYAVARGAAAGNSPDPMALQTDPLGRRAG